MDNEKKVSAHKPWVSSLMCGRLSSLPPAAGIQKWQAGKPAPHEKTLMCANKKSKWKLGDVPYPTTCKETP